MPNLVPPNMPYPNWKRPAAKKIRLTTLEEQLRFTMYLGGLPDPEWHFEWGQLIGRDYHSDAAYPDQRILLEAEGGNTPFRDKSGQLRQGRHNTITGFEEDCRKYNLAANNGWHVYRFTRGMIDDMSCLVTIRDALIYWSHGYERPQL